MKTLYLIPVFMLLASCNTPPTPKVSAAPAVTPATQTSSEGIVAEPDCDEKAKQKVEIKEDEIKLGGTDTGCKLE